MKFCTLADGRFAQVTTDLATARSMGPDTMLDYVKTQALCPAGAPVDGFDISTVHAPLPQAPQFLDGSAYVNHVDLVRRARGAQMPESFWSDPLMYQGCATFLAPTADITGDAAWGIDFEAEVAVITSDVPQGVSSAQAPEYIELIMLLNDISLRNLIPDELAKGFGFVQSKPPSACSPIAAFHSTCPGWDGRKLHGILKVDLNGQPFGRADAGIDMTFDFGDLISHAAKTRPLPAGTVIGSGTISNRDSNGGPGKPVAAGGAGYSCIAEQRMVETILMGAPVTPFLTQGDHVEIWMEDETGQDIFGRISQKVDLI